MEERTMCAGAAGGVSVMELFCILSVSVTILAVNSEVGLQGVTMGNWPKGRGSSLCYSLQVHEIL